LASGTYKADHTLAFIYRTNAQSRLIEEACVRFNVPYVVFGSFTSFYNRQEIKDCLCFLRWLHNGRDRVAMLRAIETPKRGIGDIAIREFDQYCDLVEQHWDEQYHGEGKPNALEVLFHLSGDYSWCTIPNPEFPPPEVSLSSRPHKLFIEFSRDMVEIRKIAERTSLSRTLQAIMHHFNLEKYFDKISKSKDELQERLANVDELMKAAVQYDKHGACLKVKSNTLYGSDDILSPLGSFLDDISMVTEQANSSAENGSEARFVANLMTIHSSKGMEFDSVYFVGVEDGTIPSSQVNREHALVVIIS
jgi:DNA helicase II / ATP-dependent DNA helicase PcrA